MIKYTENHSPDNLKYHTASTPFVPSSTRQYVRSSNPIRLGVGSSMLHRVGTAAVYSARKVHEPFDHRRQHP
jgi:hypothetical protein